MKSTKTKCDFCKYWSGRGCMVTPNSAYCKEAHNEYYQYLSNRTQVPVQKSLRPWDRK